MLTEVLTGPPWFFADDADDRAVPFGGKTARAEPEGRIDWASVKRVLLVRLRSIGDTVLMTACLRALKDWRPDIEISAVVEPLSAPILEQHPLVDHLLVAGRSTVARARLIRSLRRDRYDLALNMHGGGTAAIVTALSGARTTVGYRGLSQSWMLAQRAPPPDLILGRREIHSVEQQLALLRWSGMPFPPMPKLQLAVGAASRERVRETLSEMGARTWAGGFALIAPGAAFESKQWPAASFAAVARRLKDRWGLPSIVVAGPGQERIAREVAETAGPDSFALTGISLKDLIALSETARIFVGNDSGPMHIAAALDRPIVAVFGSSQPSVWRPWTEAPSRVIRCAEITRVNIGDVTEAVDELLAQGTPGID